MVQHSFARPCSTPGYVGYEQAAGRRSRARVRITSLFDEIEKAHRDLSVRSGLDDGAY